MADAGDRVKVSSAMIMEGAKAMVLLGRDRRAQGQPLPSRTEEAKACIEAALALK